MATPHPYDARILERPARASAQSNESIGLRKVPFSSEVSGAPVNDDPGLAEAGPPPNYSFPTVHLANYPTFPTPIYAPQVMQRTSTTYSQGSEAEEYKFHAAEGLSPAVKPRSISRRTFLIALAIFLSLCAIIGGAIGGTLGKKTSSNAVTNPADLVQFGATYTITNRAANTLADYNTTTGGLAGYASDGGATQKWKFEDAGLGLYFIRSTAGTAPYISFNGEPVAETLLTCLPSPQSWIIIRDVVDPSLFQVRLPSLGFSMDLVNGSSTDGTAIFLYPTGIQRNQAWAFTKI